MQYKSSLLSSATDYILLSVIVFTLRNTEIFLCMFAFFVCGNDLKLLIIYIIFLFAPVCAHVRVLVRMQLIEKVEKFWFYYKPCFYFS